jgi:hypothetical protein
MTVVATPTRSPVLAPADQPEQTFAPQTFTAPVVAAVGWLCGEHGRPRHGCPARC